MSYDDAYERACDRFEGGQREREDTIPVYWFYTSFDRGLRVTIARLRVREPRGWRTLSEVVVDGDDPSGALASLREYRRRVRAYTRGAAP